MAKIKITQAALDHLKKREMLSHCLLLIADDAGGKYSINGGTCSMGSHFSLIKVPKPDPDYPIVLKNNTAFKIYSSKYDLLMLESNLILDYQKTRLILKNDSGLLDSNVQLGDGAALLKANKHVHLTRLKNC